jgi:CHASE2 domain-containing sensor protein/serine phosphatase RsbU (regulator of sigma subunit)
MTTAATGAQGLRAHLPRWLSAFLAALFAGMLLGDVPPVLGVLDWTADRYQRIFPRERVFDKAVVVKIDEESLAAFGQWPWPRSVIARLVDDIARQQPAAIGFDILFSEPDRFAPGMIAQMLPGLGPEIVAAMRDMPGGDDLLAKAVAGQNVVVAIAGMPKADARFPAMPTVVPWRHAPDAVGGLDTFAGYLGNVATLDRAASSRGLISADDQEKIVRRARLAARFGDVVVPALSVELLRVATGQSLLRLGNRGDGLLQIGVGELTVPTQADGEFWMRYGRIDDAKYVSAADVLRGRIPAERFKDRIVLIGMTGIGLLDYKETPLGEVVPGVENHVQLIEQMAEGAFLIRPGWARLLEAALLLAGITALTLVVPRRRPRAGALVFVGALVLPVAVGLVAFRGFGVLVDAAWPVVAIATTFTALLAVTLAESDRQQRTLREAAAKVAGEFEAAKRIQMGLLPDPADVCRDDVSFDMAAFLEPARTVGGDFYDCFRVSGNRVFFIVGDVSGKGVAAALFMALAKAVVKSGAMRGEAEVGAILTTAASEMARENREALFVTAFAGMLNLRTGMLEYCNAGHEPPLGRRPGATLDRYPVADGPPLCVLEDFAFGSARRQLVPGEWLCVVTDGVTDAEDPRGNRYGIERLQRLLVAAPDGLSATALVDSVRRDIATFVAGAPAADDLTLLALRWNGPAA